MLGFFEEGGPFLFDMLTVAQQTVTGQQLLKQGFTLKEGLAAHVLPAKEENVEHAIPQLCPFITQRVLQQLEARPALRIKRDQLAIDDTRLCDGAQRLCDGGIAGSHLNTITREEPYRATPYFGDEPEAVPLGFVRQSLLSNG